MICRVSAHSDEYQLGQIQGHNVEELPRSEETTASHLREGTCDDGVLSDIGVSSQERKTVNMDKDPVVVAR